MKTPAAEKIATLTPEAIRQLRRRAGASRADADMRLMPRPPGAVLPLSFAQERLWFLEQLGAGSAYNMSMAVSVEGPLDATKLERSFFELVKRHEILRTRFELQGGACVQLIEPAETFTVGFRDFAPLDLAEARAQAARIVQEQVRCRFDLSRDRLFRVVLARIRDDEHVLVMVMHHIVCDGGSVGILLDELRQCYEAYSSGQEPKLPPLPIQYADYALWQRSEPQVRMHERQLDYWQRQLAQAPAGLSLPTDRPRPAVPSFRGGMVNRELDESLSKQLAQLSRREGVTLHMMLLTAFQLLLSRYSGQKEVIVGVPAAGRSRTQLEGLVGFFVNTLALRTDLSGDPPFRTLLQRVKQMTLDAYANQEVPFERVVAALQKGGELSRQALFQVMFMLESVPREGVEFAGLKLRGLPIDYDSAKFDMTLSIYEKPGGLSCGFEYATDLFDHSTIERFADHFEVLLRAIATDTDRRLSQLSLLCIPERREVLESWNDARREVDARSLPALFETQVARSPHAPAVACAGETLSYAELNVRANRLAHYLIECGVGPDTLVALCVERRLELVVALLAVLKAGGAYVPLDPGYPPERLSYMLQDSRPCVSIVATSSRAVLPDLPGRMLDVDAQAHLWETQSTENPHDDARSSHDLGYVIYTSGSTGRPKGSMVEQGGLKNLLAWYVHALRLVPGDVCMVVTSFSFDLTQKNILAPLLAGACVQLAPPGFDPRAIAQAIREAGVTAINATPSMYYALLESARPGELDGLRHVVLGGEPIDAGKLRGDSAPQATIVNSYGPTECTDVVLRHPFTVTAASAAGPAIPLGKPVPNTVIYLLDENLQLVPTGAVGEIHIGGLQVGRGYLNRPALTAMRFVSDPFAPDPGMRMYKTGDLGRRLANGDIEFLGRNDHQVKIRGLRIELGEIEAQLAALAGVRAAVVLACTDSAGEKRLVAYVSGESVLDTAQLRTELSRRLPEYMVPGLFVRMDQWPLTPSGKLDRRALPPPDFDASRAQSYAAPEGAVEQKLAEIWQQVLTIERAGRHDNFFELGGHSLLAVTACAKAATALGRDIPLSAWFSEPTIARLANWLGKEDRPGARSNRIKLRSSAGARHVVYYLPTVFGLGSFSKRWASRLSGAVDALSCNLPLSFDQEAVPSLTNIPDIAAYCREQMVVAGEYDSCTLFGWSFGGVVAHEMARQLCELGTPPRRLILIDAYLPAAELMDLSRLTEEGMRQMFDAELRGAGLAADVDARQQGKATVLASIYNTFKSNVAAQCSHRALTCDVPTVEIRATQSAAMLGPQPGALRALPLGRQRLMVLPGDHYSIIAQEDCERLAATLAND